MAQPSLAVVTVTYSPGRYLQTFLDSIPAATTHPVHVVMADNGSTDGAPEAAVDMYAHTPNLTVELLRTGGNIGYGSAINYAVQHLRDSENDILPDYILISNPDVKFSPGSIDALLHAAERWDNAGSLGPLIREADGTVYPSARSIPRIRNGIAHALLGSIWPSNPWTKSYLDDRDMSSERPAGWLSGSCLLVRRDAFDSINGFDEGYFMYMEDVDLGDRLGRAGWQNIFVPSAEIQHAKGHAASGHPETMLPVHHKSAYKFQADRHPHWWQAPLRWILKGGLWARCRIAVAMARRGRR